MSDNAITPLPLPLPLPPPPPPPPPSADDVSVRIATMDDVAFIDALQKRHSRTVGFMKTMAIEGKIKARQVIVAEDARGERVGYCMGQDQYFKRDDVGIIYQLNVAPGRQRGFVGATLLRAMFDRAAYGCRLFCCWCAQDIEANRFWEAMGFVPLAYRAGSADKKRLHIFWQKRIRGGDNETPWWFPSQTTGGAMSADRIVLPIPPGTHWSDAKPIVLPGVSAADEPKKLSGPPAARTPAPVARPKPKAVSRGSLLFFTPPPTPKPEKPEKKPREKKPKQKNDPRLVAAARELKDRWLERVNAGEYLFESAGKYDLTRQALPAPVSPAKLLAA
jgi:ribosomal protein S18 acetylase RimI-like enzyme